MTFIESFGGASAEELSDRTGWTKDNVGAYIGQTSENGTGYLQVKSGGGGTGFTAYICTDQGSAQHYTEIQDINFTTEPSNYPCAVRVVDRDNYVSWRLAGGGGAGSRMTSVISGSVNDEDTAQGAINDAIRLEAQSGTDYEWFIDSVSQGVTSIAGHSTTETSQGVVLGSTTALDGSYAAFEAGPLSGGAALTIQSVTQSQTLDAAGLTEHNNIAPNQLGQPQTLDIATLTQHHNMTVDALLQSQVLDATLLTQHNSITPNPLDQTQALDAVTLIVSGVLSINDASQAQTIDVVALTQHNNIMPARLDQSQVLGATTLTLGTESLVVASLSQAQLLDVAVLTQHNVLVVNDLTQQQILDGVTFGTAVGWLQGSIVIVSMLDGVIELRPALEGSHDSSPSLDGVYTIN